MNLVGELEETSPEVIKEEGKKEKGGKTPLKKKNTIFKDKQEGRKGRKWAAGGVRPTDCLLLSFFPFRDDMISPTKGEILFPENNSKLHDLYENPCDYFFVLFLFR